MAKVRGEGEKIIGEEEMTGSVGIVGRAVLGDSGGGAKASADAGFSLVHATSVDHEIPPELDLLRGIAGGRLGQRRAPFSDERRRAATL
jgi:hypothetical protein